MRQGNGSLFYEKVDNWGRYDFVNFSDSYRWFGIVKKVDKIVPSPIVNFFRSRILLLFRIFVGRFVFRLQGLFQG